MASEIAKCVAAFLQECLPHCLHVFMILVSGYYHGTKFRYSLDPLVSHFAKCIA